MGFRYRYDEHVGEREKRKARLTETFSRGAHPTEADRWWKEPALLFQFFYGAVAPLLCSCLNRFGRGRGRTAFPIPAPTALETI